MKDIPIIFSAPMVLALLREADEPGCVDGKTTTRRLITKARVFATPERPAWTLRTDALARALQNADRFRRVDGNGWFWEADAFEWQAPHTRTGWMAHIGYAPGDRLWVREAVKAQPDNDGWDGVRYLADNAWIRSTAANADEADDFVDLYHYGRKRGASVPSIHMPRWASRLTLIVTDVKIERLQDISEEDGRREGCALYIPGHGWISRDELAAEPGYANFLSGRLGFQEIWMTLHGEQSWRENPWVVAPIFRVIKANIDTPEARVA